MKENIMVETVNVKKALRYVQALLQRPVTEMVGLMLIYGRPGLGKTRFGERLAYSNGFIYERLEASMSVKDFMTLLLLDLKYKYHEEPKIPRGSANVILQDIKRILDEHPNTVIVVDEIDYAFGNRKLLGTIRDIVDETVSVIILIGMQNAHTELKKTNEHFFDRCNFILEFEKNTKKDLQKMSKEVCTSDIDAEIVELIYQNTKGNFRKSVKLLNMREQTTDPEAFKTSLRKLLEQKRTAK